MLTFETTSLTHKLASVGSKKLIVTMVVQNSREELKAAYHKKQKKMKARILAMVFRNGRQGQLRANANAGQQANANANANAAVVAAAAAVLVPDVVEEPENAVDD